MADSVALLIQLLLDKSAKQQTEQGIDDITKSLVNMDSEGIERATEGLAKLSKEQEKLVQTFRSAKKEMEAMRKLSTDLDRGSTKLMAAGTAVIGGIYLAANSEAKRIKEAGGVVDETTKRWLDAQGRIQKSYQSIGRSAMSGLLPILEDAADLAEKAAVFAEKNPNLVKGLATAAGIAVAVGALGKIIAGGLRVYADVKYIAANAEYLTGTLIFQKSVREFLTGVAAQAAASKAGGGMLFAPAEKTVAAGSAGSILGTALLTAVAAWIGTQGGEFLGNKLGRAAFGENPDSPAGPGDYNAADALVGTAMITQGALYRVVDVLGNAGVVADGFAEKMGNFFTKFDYAAAKLLGANKIASVIRNLNDGVVDLGDSSETTTDSILGTADALRSAASAYGQFQQANAEEMQRYNQEKASIESNYTSQVQGLYQSHAMAMASIAGSLSSSLANIESNYQAAEAQAQAEYYAQRGEIVASGEERIRQIQEDAQERLRKLAQEHADRVEQLTNSRDALGLAQENRNYEQQVAEEKRQAQQEMARARRETQQQLAELDRRYALEKQQREEQYQRDLEAARQQADEQSAQETLAFQQQLAELQKSKEQELKELEQSHNNEMASNRSAFINKLRELGYYLGNDFNLQYDWHQKMLDETKRFLEAQHALYAEQEAGDAPGYASGGYAYPGMIRIEPGQREFVMNSRTTRAAEQMIGSRLSQDNLLNAMVSGLSGGAAQNIVVQVNDGMTLLQVRRVLEKSNRSIVNGLSSALRSIK